jgi:hypothetical protein
MNATKGPAAYARELEEDAKRYPDEAGELLLEAAGQWQHAGEHAHAVQVLQRVLPLGGLDGSGRKYKKCCSSPANRSEASARPESS